MKNLFALFTIILFFSCQDESIDGTPDGSDPRLAYALSDSKGSTYIDSVPSPLPGNGVDSVSYEPGLITAAEWNDLDHWEFWQNISENEFKEFIPIYKINPVQRFELELTNNDGKQLIDVPVELIYNNLSVWKAKTDNNGKAVLWLNVFTPVTDFDPLLLQLKVNAQLSSIKLTSYENGINQVVINQWNENPQLVEIAFMVDATGSMGDELEYLKSELLDVINRVQSDNQAIQINMSALFYRDEGDDYVTRTSDFSSDINKTVSFIKAQQADGGGDTPEAVHTALEECIHQLHWSETALARLLFVILDAPPHDEESYFQQIRESMQKSAEKGIKIIPVSASGIDTKTEFLLRTMSITTNSTYVFITNDSGIGNDHLEPTVGEYEVEYLNDLMVRLINKYTQK